MTTRPQADALRGSRDLLVLKTLSLVPMHGWGISQPPGSGFAKPSQTDDADERKATGRMSPNAGVALRAPDWMGAAMWT